MEKNCTSILDCKEKKICSFIKNGYIIFDCRKCGQRFSEIKDSLNHVAEVYSDHYFFEGKAGYPDYLIQKDLLYNYGKRYAKIISRFSSPGRLLDVGCAAGFIMKGFEDSLWKVEGLEPNNTMASYGRENLNLKISTGSLETFSTSEKFDMVTMIQVIGHFYDLDKALARVKSLLNTDGLVLVESWNMKSTVAKLMGKQWHEYSPPSVVHWFSDESLSALFSFYGFDLIAKGYPPKRINLKHAISLVQEKTPNFYYKKKVFAILNRTFGKWTIKYPPIDLKWYLFKKK